jgi:hypothetical protein
LENTDSTGRVDPSPDSKSESDDLECSEECYLTLGFFILTLIGDGGPLSGPNYGFCGLGRIWQNKGLSPLAIFSGLFNFPPPLSLKSINIYLHSSRAKAKKVTSRLAFLF